MNTSLENISPGVVSGTDAETIYNHALKNGYALPAVNVVGTNSVNAVLECAKLVRSPVIIQVSNGGAAFFIGKGVGENAIENSIRGSIAAAHYIDIAAKFYGVPVILHTDHAAKKLLPWIDGLIQANRDHLTKSGRTLFSSHMLDLSEEPLTDNIKTSAQYYRELNELGMGIEIELGCTGGEEDGVDNSDLDSSLLYTQPEEVAEAYKVLSNIGSNFNIAAAFGNVHGVYKPGNVQLRPEILKNSRDYLKDYLSSAQGPLRYVFHGGSGSALEDIHDAIDYGVVKMNIDTDTQWASWQGVLDYYSENSGYLQSQIGNPAGSDKPNKKYYDPRVWLRKAEVSMVSRLKTSFSDLKCVNRYE
ncbi:class II fructose-bisphosphate aldolase [Gilvimarinus agarilyticus]|uniref:class II fructose-bisphosphate aldolase n=1 Tax=Gilvimarinus sp. 2_MG-2023 TaxID=3062666 RepID=UPI001C08F15C|nr:class II fructose-bisphosphate aldolase [Gilvimarinus sp. 2_MG-2023]MBU2886704.1 class II fructose-bisphosphate aldolase [Gilvimarinus agarilyticus]MDO6571370.1 class II fructose-bisphosphate aldolase [Gilvimarinus sp. 2_MG-2023]